jgi:adenosylcobinamide kinase/adenosylcobinamide-phosphate guanylyltransferase
MEVVVLGTAGAGGRPNAFCRCRLCTDALASGDVRAQTSALVDGRLLLDCGPEVPYAATRAGRSLAGVRHLLLTHSHPDHAGPMALLARTWAGRTEQLDVVGPPQALAVFADWIGPDDPVRPLAVRAGDRLDLDGYAVAVLEADHGDEHTGPGVLYDVTAPDGGTVLYATDTGPLPASTRAAVTGRAYDVVLLEESFGDRTDHGTRHLDLASFAAAVEDLRGRGAVVPATDVVAVHLGHHDPAPAELAARLATVGARVVPDGTVLGRPRRGTRTLVLGGARSGKSVHAESLLRDHADVTYVATGGSRPDDEEWALRIAAHRARRPLAWRTVETGDVTAELSAAGPADAVLVDCVSLWLAGVMDAAGVWPSDDASSGTSPAPADADVARRCGDLIDALAGSSATVVVVSNEVGSGVVPGTFSGRRFRDELGRLNARLAGVSDRVTLLVAGVPVDLRSTHPGMERA